MDRWDEESFLLLILIYSSVEENNALRLILLFYPRKSKNVLKKLVNVSWSSHP